MTHENDNHKRHGSRAGAAWIVIGMVFAFLVITGVYWAGHNSSDTASKNTPTQTTGGR